MSVSYSRVANQETIVELIGFTQRVLGSKSAPKKASSESHLAARIASTSLLSVVPIEDEIKVTLTLAFIKETISSNFIYYLLPMFP